MTKLEELKLACDKADKVCDEADEAWDRATKAYEVELRLQRGLNDK